MEHSELTQLFTPLGISLAIGIIAGALAAWWIQHFRLKRDPEQSPERFRVLNQQLGKFQSEKAKLEGILAERDQERRQLRTELDGREVQCQNVSQELATARANMAHLKEQLVAKQGDLENMHKSLQDRFEHLAQGILDKTSEKFTKNNREAMGNLLTPLKQSMDTFREKVENTHRDQVEGRGKLFNELKQLRDLNQQLSTEASNLTSALKGEAQTMGAWGELILETVLSKSGLTKGEEFEVQAHVKDGEGKNQRPDVVVHYPEQKGCLVIDSKVSLVAYERFCNDDSEGGRERARKEHLLSVRSHIQALSGKKYEQSPDLTTPEFVLMFIPVEHAFNVAVQADPKLYDYAFERNIVIITPTTLLVTLKMVKSIWRQDKQSRNAEEIARRGGLLYDKFVGFYESMVTIGSHLVKTQSAYDQALNQLQDGRGSLTSQVDHLRQLGAKVSKPLPANALPDHGEEGDLGKEEKEGLTRRRGDAEGEDGVGFRN
jgi:DNA recombination protein RmuC